MSRTPDVGRISEAVSRPGIDPRAWQSLAIVTAVSVTSSGVKVDIALMPSGMEETARVGAEFAGNGIGLYVPIKVDDEVIVGYPEGNRAAGLVVMRRLHSAGDPLPAKAVAAPNDVWLVVDGSTNVNLITASGKVRLGDSVGTSPVARVGDTVRITQAQLTAAGAQAAGNPVTITDAPPGTGYIEATIHSGASKVEAK